MNRLVTVSVAVLFASIPLAAQNPAPKPASGPAQTLNADRKPAPSFEGKGRLLSGDSFTAMPPSTGCPVSMRAEHRAYGDMMTVDRGRDSGKGNPGGAAQRIHLILGKGSDSERVVAVRITVHGTSNKPRTVVAEPRVTGPRLNGSPDARKTLDLTFNDREKDEASADLLLRGFTSVTSITLDSLTFADGSMWMPDFGKACRIVPDPLMLVAGR
jgi:hypothetical protein